MKGELSVKEEEKNVQVGEESGNSEFGIRNSESENGNGADEAVGDKLADESAADAAESVSEDGADVVADAAGTDGEDVAADVAGGKGWARLIEPQYNRRLPFSLLAAFFGAFLGLFPATLLALSFEMAFYPLFVAAPLLAFLLNKLFDGGRDIRTFSIIALFSLASAYVTTLSCQVARIVSYFNVSILNIPAFTIEAFIEPELLPWSTSAYLYPFLFTALGLAVTWVLLRKQADRPVGEDSLEERRVPDGEDVAAPVDGEELSDPVDGEESSDSADGEEPSESADGEESGESADDELSDSADDELGESVDGDSCESDDGDSSD